MVRKRKMLTNRRAGLYGVLMAIAIIFIGGLLYIVLNLVMEGSDTSDGLIDIAVNQSWVNTSDNTYKVVAYGWKSVPLAVMLGGFLYLIMQSQRREPDIVPYGRY